ncbi:hypothetical protein EXN66_Car003783 [Channa argus]|uniref:Uncharacterized protein n=1 Tax=Channa argus TaxID=215402 RepID=A0A6G1PCT4_CHAAH|nr:hypothetical protein EXN66_Car003783 [Channa argus]
MAGLCWMPVVLTFFLSAGSSVAAVDQNRLATIVNGILRQYGTQGMFSLAVTVPDNLNQNINQVLQQILQSDPADNVKNKVNNGEVYVGTRVVAAKVLKHLTGGADHAESRVVDNLNNLVNGRNNNDLMLFYVYASPCVEKCSSDTHRLSILERIKPINQWPNRAVVFSKIFRPNTGPGNTDEQRGEALQRLGSSVGLTNIFRCDGSRQLQCTSCYNERERNNVANYCISG